MPVYQDLENCQGYNGAVLFYFGEYVKFWFITALLVFALPQTTQPDGA
jgi:hypothetical protein